LLSIKSNTYESENSQNRAFSTGSLGAENHSKGEIRGD
jgi:hypothetical protein